MDGRRRQPTRRVCVIDAQLRGARRCPRAIWRQSLLCDQELEVAGSMAKPAPARSDRTRRPSLPGTTKEDQPRRLNASGADPAKTS